MHRALAQSRAVNRTSVSPMASRSRREDAGDLGGRRDAQATYSPMASRSPGLPPRDPGPPQSPEVGTPRAYVARSEPRRGRGAGVQSIRVDMPSSEPRGGVVRRGEGSPSQMVDPQSTEKRGYASQARRSLRL